MYLERTKSFFLWGLNLRHNVIIHPKHGDWDSSTPFIPKRAHSTFYRYKPSSLGIRGHHTGFLINNTSLNRCIEAKKSERRGWIECETLQPGNKASRKCEHGRATKTERISTKRIEKLKMWRIARLPRWRYQKIRRSHSSLCTGAGWDLGF